MDLQDERLRRFVSLNLSLVNSIGIGINRMSIVVRGIDKTTTSSSRGRVDKRKDRAEILSESVTHFTRNLSDGTGL